MGIFDYQCICGHVEEEHEHGFFKPCTLCDCDDFEGNGESDPDEDE